MYWQVFIFLFFTVSVASTCIFVFHICVYNVSCRGGRSRNKMVIRLTLLPVHGSPTLLALVQPHWRSNRSCSYSVYRDRCIRTRFPISRPSRWPPTYHWQRRQAQQHDNNDDILFPRRKGSVWRQSLCVARQLPGGTTSPWSFVCPVRFWTPLIRT